MTGPDAAEQRIRVLEAEVARLSRLVEGYRRLHPRLIAQAGIARLEAQGIAAKPIGCAGMHPDGWVCDLMHGHGGYHTHGESGATGRRVWRDA